MVQKAERCMKTTELKIISAGKLAKNLFISLLKTYRRMNLYY